ncbi:interleukin-21 [Dicentrarchus labrax]|uniref:interleukin-21 n=1 Tax=Dicentrarchus labrax TaxID=13489 RepID=UPI00163079B0|nr:interleukin-21 [Dicentrarchus labrax]
MKLLVFCLFAVCCCSLANSTSNRILQRKKLQEILKQLKDVRQSLQMQQNDQMLNTPENIGDCCSLSALECFRANLQVKFNMTNKKHIKFYRSLNNTITVQGLDFCNSPNGKSTCPDCLSHPMKNANEFFNGLMTLIQKGITRLNSMN